MQVLCVLIRDQEVIFDFVEACFRFGAKLAWTHEAVFLEFPEPQSAASLERLFCELEGLAAHFDVQTKISAAEDAPTALCFAHFGISAREKLPIEALRYYASPFRTFPEIDRVLRELRRERILQLQDLRSFLPHAIRVRYGALAMQAFQRWCDRSGAGWPGFQFLENFAMAAEQQQQSNALFYNAS